MDADSINTIDDIKRQLEKCSQEIEENRKLFQTFSINVTEQLNPRQYIEELNNVHKSFDETRKKVSDIHKTAKFILEHKDLFYTLPDILQTEANSIQKISRREDKLKVELVKLKNDASAKFQKSFQRITDLEAFQTGESDRLNNFKATIETEYTNLINMSMEMVVRDTNTTLMNNYMSTNEYLIDIEKRNQDSINELKKQIDIAKQEAIDKSAENVLDIRRSLSDAHEKINQLFDKTNSIELSIEAVNQRIDDLSQIVDKNKNEHDELEAKFQQQNEANDTKFQKISDDFLSLNNLLEQSIKTTIKEFMEEVNHLQSQINNLNTSQNKTFDLIDQIHETENQIKADHTFLSNLLNSKEEAILKVQNDIIEQNNDLNKKVRACNARNEDIASKIDFIQGSEEISLSDLKLLMDQSLSNIKNIQLDVNKKIENSYEEMKKEINSANERYISDVNDLRGELENAGESMEKQLDIKIQTASDKFNNMINGIEEQSKQTNELISQFLSDSSMTLPEIVTKINQIDYTLENALLNLQHESDRFAFEIKQQFDQFLAQIDGSNKNIENTKNELQSFSKLVLKKIEVDRQNNNNFFSKQNKIIEKLKLDTKDKINQITNSANDQNAKLQNAILDIARYISPLSQDSFKSIRDEIDQMSDELQEKIAETENKYQDLLKTFQLIKGNSSLTFEELINRFQELQTRLDESMKSNESKLDQKIEEMKNHVNTFEDNSLQRNEQTLTSIIELQDSLHTVLDKNTKHVNDALQDNITNFKSMIESLENKISHLTGGDADITFSSIITKVNSLEDLAKTNNNENLEKIKEIEQKFDEKSFILDSTISDFNNKNNLRKKEIENCQKLLEEHVNELKQSFKQDNMNLLNKLQVSQESNDKRYLENVSNFTEINKKITDFITESRNKINEISTNNSHSIQESHEAIKDSVQNSVDSMNSKLSTIEKMFQYLRGDDGLDIPSLIQRMESFEKYTKGQLDNFKSQADKTADDLNSLLNNSSISINNRISQMQEDYTMKFETFKKQNDEFSKICNRNIEKLNSFIQLKLRKLDEKIINIDGGAEISLNDIYIAYNESNSKLKELISEINNEISSIKSKQERLPNEILKQITNDFNKIIHANNSNNETISQKLSEIIAKQEGFITPNIIQELMEKVNEISEIQISNLNETDERIKNEFNELFIKFQDEIRNKFKEQAEIIRNVTDIINTLNGGADSSLSQAFEKIKQLEAEVEKEKQHIIEIDEYTIKNIRESQTRLDTETDSVKTNIEKVRQDFNVLIKKMTDEITESNRINTQKISVIDNSFRLLENNLTDQLSKKEKILSDKYNSFTHQLTNIVEKVEADLITTKASFDKVNTHHISFSRSTKDLLEALNADINARFNLVQSSIKSEHADIMNEVKSIITEETSQISESSRENFEKVNTNLIQLRLEFDSLKGGATLSLPIIIDRVNKAVALIEEKESSNVKSVESLSEKTESFLTNANNMFDTKFKKIKQTLKDIQSKQKQDKEFESDAILKATETLREEMRDIEKRFSANSDAIVKNKEEELLKMRELSKNIQDQNEAQFIKLSKQLDELSSRIEDTRTNEKDQLTEYLAGIEDQIFKRNGNDIQELASKVIQKVRLELQQTIDKANESSSQLKLNVSEINAKSDLIAIQTKKIVENAISENNAYIDELRDSIQSKLVHLKKKIDSTSSALEKLKENSQNTEAKIESILTLKSQ